MEGLITGVDEAALQEHYLAEMLAESARLGASAGIEGWQQDDEAFLKNWGFSVEDVSVPVRLSGWQGSQDVMVSAAHGVWLAANLTDVSAHLMPEEGHLSLMTRQLGAMLDEAVDRGGL